METSQKIVAMRVSAAPHRPPGADDLAKNADDDLPSGWWIALAAVLGLAFWVGVFWVALT